MTWMTRLMIEEAGHDASKRPVWELAKPLYYESDEHGPIVAIPPFRTNFASVPRLPFIFWLTGGIAEKEATIHDWLYTVHETSREVADQVFLEALLKNPFVGEGRAKAMYNAVRLFGQSSWDDTTNILQAEEIRALIR